MPLHKLHRGTLAAVDRGTASQAPRLAAINHGLAVVRHILNLAANEWVDEHGLTWLAGAPKIKAIGPVTDKRQPFRLNWDEAGELVQELPRHWRDGAFRRQHR